MSYDTLTLTFQITDKEKFREFHQKVFPGIREQPKCQEEIGGFAIISSWSNPFDENEKLNNALEFSMNIMDFDDTRICELISEGKSEDEAKKILNNEKYGDEE